MRPYKLRTAGNVMVVEITTLGLMEGSELDLMAEHLSEEMMRANDKRMVLDCHRLKFVASAALSMIVNLSHMAKQFKGGVVICGVQPQVSSILKISGLNRHIPVCVTPDEAVAMLTDPAGGTCT